MSQGKPPQKNAPAPAKRQVNSPAKSKFTEIREYVKERLPMLRGLVASDADATALLAGLYTNIKKVPELLQCDKDDLWMAVCYAAHLDLPLGAPRGGITLVAFFNKAKNRYQITPMVDYRGYEMLAYRSGLVSDIKAVMVLPEDEFEYHEGTDSYITHKPKLGLDRASPKAYDRMICMYAVAQMKEGPAAFVVLDKPTIEWYRSKSKQSHGTTWNDFTVAMGKKTCIIRLCNDLPQLGARMQLAVENDMRIEAGKAPLMDVTGAVKAANLAKEDVGFPENEDTATDTRPNPPAQPDPRANAEEAQVKPVAKTDAGEGFPVGEFKMRLEDMVTTIGSGQAIWDFWLRHRVAMQKIHCTEQGQWIHICKEVLKAMEACGDPRPHASEGMPSWKDANA